MANKRTHCMRCGNQGIRAERDGKEIYTCQAMGHGVIASYDIPVEEPEPVKPAEPEVAGSGTDRWPDGADHWTQTGDGTDYPGSYGVGPLKPFVPFETPETPAAPPEQSGLNQGDEEHGE